MSRIQKKVLQKINYVLKKGGIVYIDVPNFDSLSRKIAGQSWKYMLPNEHVHQFEPKSLEALVKSANLKMIKHMTWSGIFDVQDPVALFVYKLTHFKKSLFTDVLAIPGNILATLLNRGTNLVIIAKK